MKKLPDYRSLIYKLRFSVELEVEFPEKIDVSVLRTRYRKLLNSWTVVTEGSLINGIEFKPKNKNKLYFKKESLAEISEILHIIRKHKGKVDGDKCGFHVHVDARKFTSQDILKIVKEMIARQKFIARDLKVRPERLQQYCQFIKKSDIKNLTPEVIDTFRNSHIYINNEIPYLSSKYYVLNLCSLQNYNTIEFRLPNGQKYLREMKRIIKYLYEFLITSLERE